jgi:type II secretion system protein N
MAIKLPFQVPRINLGPRMRRIVRYAGLAVFAVIVFVFAFQMSFPYGRAKDKVVELLSDKYEVTIGGVERGWVPGRVYFTAVSLRTRQSKPEEVVTTFYLARVEVDLSLLPLIRGVIEVDFDAKIGAGSMSGTVALEKFGKGSIRAEVVGESLPGASLPIRAALGLPMTGKLELSGNISLPVEKNKTGRTFINWQKSSGSFSLACPSGCTFGDGKTKLRPLLKNTRQQVMVADGIDFGKVNLDSLVAKATIKGGKLTLDKLDARSKDGDLKVDFMMTLEKEWGESMVAGCLRFKGSDDLLRREPKTHAAISTTGAELRGDGLFHIRLTDRFKDMKRLNQECGPNTQINNAENFGNRNERPNLTVQPDEAAKPTLGTTNIPNIPIPPAADAAAAPHDAAMPTPPTATPPPATPPESQREKPQGDQPVHEGSATGSATGAEGNP